MKEKIHFRAKIAGLVFDVTCNYESTRRLCRDYLISDEEDALETVFISEEDLLQERALLLKKKQPDQELEASTPAALEALHLCRRIVRILPKYDRVLFHSSALSIDGNGVLFTAKSGTGKSTHTRLWREAYGDRVQMVNDDKPILHIGEHAVTVYGTPWRGKHGLGENISAPVKAVCYVCRGDENRIDAADRKELYPILLQQTFTPDAPEDMLRTLALVDRLSRQVALYRLYCNMAPEAALVAREGMNLQ